MTSPGQRLQHHALRGLMGLPTRVQRALTLPHLREAAGERPLAEIGLLLTVRRLAGGPSIAALSVRAAREKLRAEVAVADGPPPPVGRVRDLEVAGGLRARHYAPQGGSDALLVYFHGGGYAIGDLDTHDAPCRLLCRDAGVHVLSVEYRLGPEHPFPAALEDGAAAVEWAAEHAAELGAARGRLLVGGDSAGGNLAAVTAQAAARRELPPLTGQLLIYPATDYAGRWPSHDPFNDGYLLDLEERLWYRRNYLGGTGADPADPRVSPLRASDLAGVAPAVVVTAALDPLRDEGEAYAAALAAAGVPVHGLRLSGQVHGFLHLTGVSPAARWAVQTVARAVRSELLDPAPPARSRATAAT